MEIFDNGKRKYVSSLPTARTPAEKHVIKSYQENEKRQKKSVEITQGLISKEIARIESLKAKSKEELVKIILDFEKRVGELEQEVKEKGQE